MNVSGKVTNFIAVILLGTMFLLALFSMKGDSLTFDESSHLPAGYSYLVKRDYRINPEHPPLIKDLSAIPLLFLKLNFPENDPSWTQTSINGRQWEFGNKFLYSTGNNADKIIFWGRIPMIFILLILGFYTFRWTKELAGNKAAILALTLFSFSPTFLAHGRLVTTDVGAAAGFLIASYYFLKFLNKPSKRHLLFSGISLGGALLIKFSAILLIPYFCFLLFVFWLLKSWVEFEKKPRYFIKSAIKNFCLDFRALAIIFVLAFIVVGILYQFNISGYPHQKQIEDTEKFLENSNQTVLKNIDIWMVKTSFLRQYAEYFLGLLKAQQRTASGNTTFFLGKVSASSWWYYFPVVYAIKVPLAFHVLLLVAIITFIFGVKTRFSKTVTILKQSRDWVLKHFVEFSLFVFIIFYWLVSIRTNLNIGIRHLLPAFPFAYIIVSSQISKWVDKKSSNDGELKDGLRKEFVVLGKYVFVTVLIFWYIGSVIRIYPHFIAYFNELIGGPRNGHLYVVDSNLDWGQDMYRLVDFAKKNNIDKIQLHYFGGADPKYYLGEKFFGWSPEKGCPDQGWFAISLTELQGRRAIPVKGFQPLPQERYDCLKGKEPTAKVGYSIWVYNFR